MKILQNNMLQTIMLYVFILINLMTAIIIVGTFWGINEIPFEQLRDFAWSYQSKENYIIFVSITNLVLAACFGFSIWLYRRSKYVWAFATAVLPYVMSLLLRGL